jgi:hypothetical protein
VAWLFALALLAAPPAASRKPDPRPATSPGFPLRIVGLGGDPAAPEVRLHLEHCLRLGFNAAWVEAGYAGRWDRETAPEGPVLDPRFAQWAREAGRAGLRLFLVIRPLSGPEGSFVFNRPDDLERIRAFIRESRRRAGIRDFVLSFEDAPLRLQELQDLLRFGKMAAPAHLAAAGSLRRALPRKTRLWFLPTIASTRGLREESIQYSATLLAGLPALERRVGMIWNGPEPVSTTVTAADLAELRSIAGDRRVILQDRYPSGLGPERMPLALALAPLRGRDPRLCERLDGYLSVPMAELGGSRLALRTIADFLRHPDRYDPDASWRAAIAALAGKDPSALDALRTQAMEWGGWVAERNYRSPLRDNPISASEDLRDPAALALWSWVERRYPVRMWELGGLEDSAFRADLLQVMGRRLVVARAMPLVRDLRSALAAGSPETALLIGRLRRQRLEAAAEPSALVALDRFLAASGIAPLVVGRQLNSP